MNETERLLTENNGSDICTCGHLKVAHEVEGIDACNDCCLSMWIPSNSICTEYKRDNLKYLEAIYNKNNSSRYLLNESYKI